ncbi:tRNA methyltransferase 1 [Nowakowskiella sp. JEL0078]|nr:tRNA methyltransferase 1 [Nowakowskiella sp. JEL0078]
METVESNLIKEGKAEIVFPDGKVFYNNVQEFNRDMSVAAITTWRELYLAQKAAKKLKKQTAGDEIRILEALSATGLRSFRYAKEIPGPLSIIANDFDSLAVEQIKNNIKHNDLEGTVIPSIGDANLVMHQAASTNTKFDVVDLTRCKDPYGSASPFIDAAVQCVSEGGLLCITCTDMAVLAGGQYDACWAKYGTMPVPNASYCHEMACNNGDFIYLSFIFLKALRAVLNCIQTSAGRYKRYIVPLASCSIDFYVRVFVQVFTSPLESKGAARITFDRYKIAKQEWFIIAQDVGGPFWSGSLHNKTFVENWLNHIKISSIENYKTHSRMLGMVTVISEELDVPFYYTLPTLCATIHVSCPPFIKICSALYSQNIKFSISHANPSSLKVDANPQVIWDIMRSWAIVSPPTAKSLEKDAVAKKILAKEKLVLADFTEIKESEPKSRKIKLVRFQENPEKDWGPKARATGSGRKKHEGDEIKTSNFEYGKKRAGDDSIECETTLKKEKIGNASELSKQES